MTSWSDKSKVFVMNLELPGAGFGACVLATINQARFCDRAGYLPVAKYDRTSSNAFFDPKRGNSMWEQYFEPLVSEWSCEDLERRLADASDPLTHADVITLPDAEVWKALAHPMSVCSFTYADWRHQPPADLDAWYNVQRSRARETVSRYVRPKRDILEAVESFWTANVGDAPILGIHMRGTDFHYAPPVSPAEYFPLVEKHIEANPGLRIFLATEQKQYVDLMRKQYGDRLVTSDVARSSNEIAPFQMKEVPPHKRGEDVLIDILFLSRCDHLIKGASNVGEMAMYFSPSLTCTDLSLGKEKAFGQDYGKGWDFKSSKPAWALLKNTDLTAVPRNASSQSRGEWLTSQGRKAYVRLVGHPLWKGKQALKRVLSRVVGS